MISKYTMVIITGTTLALSVIWPPSISSPNKDIQIQPPLILQPYQSPTLHLDPLKEYNDRSMQRIMDQILADSMTQ